MCSTKQPPLFFFLCSYVLEHCMVFPYLGAHGAFPAALAEKQGAVDTYLRLNATAYALVAPAMGSPQLGAALVASTELGVFAASIVLQACGRGGRECEGGASSTAFIVDLPPPSSPRAGRSWRGAGSATTRRRRASTT